MIEPADYSKLLDRDIFEFIARTESHYPPGLMLPDMQAQRLVYNNMCKDFAVDYPAGISSSDEKIVSKDGAVPVRRYSNQSNNALAHIVYMHGGGYVLGNLDTHDDYCAELSFSTQLNLTAIDYRLAPEHKHPAAFEDCLAVVLFEAERLKVPLLLCGDSAGGNLCAAVSHRLRNLGLSNLVKGQVLLYPELGGDVSGGSYVTHVNAPMLTKEEVDYFRNIRRTDKSPAVDATLLPLQETNFTDLPVTHCISAECDPLSDDGKDYCNAIIKAGGDAHWRNEQGLVHGFIRARHLSEKAQNSFIFTVQCLKQLAAR